MQIKTKINRDVKQLKLAKKIYMLANEIEKNRLLEEKRRTTEMKARRDYKKTLFES